MDRDTISLISFKFIDSHGKSAINGRGTRNLMKGESGKEGRIGDLLIDMGERGGWYQRHPMNQNK